MIVRLNFEMGSNSSSFLSLYQNTCMMHVQTLEHKVLAGDKFIYHIQSEFAPFTVCKLVAWPFCIVFTGPGTQKNQYPDLNLAA